MPKIRESVACQLINQGNGYQGGQHGRTIYVTFEQMRLIFPALSQIPS
jgi:hypothetical protein